MARQPADQIHALSVPTLVGTLLVPSATIAEVVNISALTPVPLSPPWLVGAIGWRTLAVPVISIEALFGKAPTRPGPMSKAVVFYPLAAREQWEFFALLSASEPRPQAVNNSAVSLAAAELPQTPYVAAGLKFNGQPLWIPDFEALKKAFYPL